jgi:hypothetical protein
MTTEITRCLSECTQVIHQLFFCLDESRYDTLAGLFDAAGVWHRQGEVLAGTEQILHAMRQRSTTQRIRHVISNCFIESGSRDCANLVAYMTAYRFDDGTMRTGPVAISSPFRISLVRASLRRTDDAWKIAELNLVPEFEFISQQAGGAGQ